MELKKWLTVSIALHAISLVMVLYILSGVKQQSNQLEHTINAISAGCTVRYHAYQPPRQLSKVLLDYLELHSKITDPQDNSVPKKFFISHQSDLAGFGNRMLQLTAALVFSIMTDRALVFDWLNDQPTNYSPNERIAHSKWEDLFAHPGFDYQAPLVMRQFPHLGVTELGGIWTFMENCRETNWTILYSNDTVLRLDGGFYYWALPLHDMPLFKEKFPDKIYRDPFNVMHELMHYLFHPSKTIKTDIDNFNQLNPTPCTLGLQIRKGWEDKVTYSDDLYLECALKRDHTTIVTVNTTGKPNLPDKHWYLSTDSKATQDFMTKQILHPKISSTAKYLGCRDLPECNREAVRDLWQLAQCSALVATDASTFGKTAAILGGIKSIYSVSKCELEVFGEGDGF